MLEGKNLKILRKFSNFISFSVLQFYLSMQKAFLILRHFIKGINKTYDKKMN